MPRLSKIPPRVTLRSLAQSAGVSIGSVSSVLNNRHIERRISMETVEKIRAAALEHGYLPNINARRLRSHTPSKDTLVIALVTSFEAPLTLLSEFVRALRTVLPSAHPAGMGLSFSLVIEMFSAGRLSEMPGLLSADHFNAAVIANTTPQDDEFLQRAYLPFPVVLINRAITGYSYVVEDSESGVKAADVLLQARRNKLCVLHGTPVTQITQTRLNGFLKRAAGRTGCLAQEIIANALTASAASDAVQAALADGMECNGLYAVTDGLAMGAYHALKQHGLKIPRDVAVLGVGDYDISPFFEPPLSIVGVDHKRVAEEASRLMARLLQRQGREPERVVVPVGSILRASTGHSS